MVIPASTVPALTSDDPRERLRSLVTALASTMTATLPLGRELIRLTVDPPDGETGPRRGYRRVACIETAIAPLRPEFDDAAFEGLVSGLAGVLGWESFVVLTDVRGLDHAAASAVVLDTALAIFDAARL